MEPFRWAYIGSGGIARNTARCVPKGGHAIGAGRVMSRKKAFEDLSLEEYAQTMAGIYTTSVNEKTLDEAPMAYKRLEDIIGDIEESVDVLDIIRPVYNFKASEDLPSRRDRKA